jgi:hypothetical protein
MRCEGKPDEDAKEEAKAEESEEAIRISVY